MQEWEGTTDYATGGGNRAAYYLAQENTADASKHSVLAGQAPSGSVLRLTKSFDLPTSQEGHDDPRHARQQHGGERQEGQLRVGREPVDAPAHREVERTSGHG